MGAHVSIDVEGNVSTPECVQQVNRFGGGNVMVWPRIHHGYCTHGRCTHGHHISRRDHVASERERNVLFNDALNTFYLRLYGVRHMVKDHSDSEKGNPLPPHGLLFPISSKGSFICIIPQTG